MKTCMLTSKNDSNKNVNIPNNNTQRVLRKDNSNRTAEKPEVFLPTVNSNESSSTQLVISEVTVYFDNWPSYYYYYYASSNDTVSLNYALDIFTRDQYTPLYKYMWV